MKMKYKVYYNLTVKKKQFTFQIPMSSRALAKIAKAPSTIAKA